MLGAGLVEPLLAVLRKGLSLGWHELVEQQGIVALLIDTAIGAGIIILPLLLVSFGTVALCGLLQTGFNFHVERLEWRFERLDVVSNMGRLISLKSVVVLALALVKLLIVGWIFWDTVSNKIPDPTRLAVLSVHDLATVTADLCLTLAMRTGLFLLVVGIADFFWQRWSFSRDA